MSFSFVIDEDWGSIFGFKNVSAAEKRYLIYTVVSILSDEDETLTQIYLRTDIWYLKGLSVATCVVKCNDFHSLQPPDQPTNVPRHFWPASVPVLGSHSKYNQRGRVSRNELKWSLSVSVSVISISDLKEINHVPGEKCNVYKKLFLEFLMMPEINIFPEDCSPEVGCHNVQAGINTHCSWSHLHPWVTIYSYLLLSTDIYWYLLISTHPCCQWPSPPPARAGVRPAAGGRSYPGPQPPPCHQSSPETLSS